MSFISPFDRYSAFRPFLLFIHICESGGKNTPLSKKPPNKSGGFGLFFINTVWPFCW